MTLSYHITKTKNADISGATVTENNNNNNNNNNNSAMNLAIDVVN